MTPTTPCTIFAGDRRVASGPLGEMAIVFKRELRRQKEAVLLFDDTTGQSFDIDPRGTDEAVLARLSQPPAPVEQAPREPGRPKLGVVGREVTLLPRHWDWLTVQPGGASVALRKLVEDARRASGRKDRSRQALEAAYYFMSAMAGNRPGFEEAARALFAKDRQRFKGLVAAWPDDVRNHAMALAWRN